MNLNKLTIGQAREIAEMFGNQQPGSVITNSLIGQYVIVRSRNEGVNAGTLLAADNTGCVLSDARRIWYHKPAATNTAWYEGVAVSGLSSDSKISCAVEKKIIIEDYSLTECTELAEKSIRAHPSHSS